MPHRIPRTLSVALLAIALLAAAAFAFTRGGDGRRFAEACPPGYVTEAQHEARERRALRGAKAAGDTGTVRAVEAERERESRDGGADCRRNKAPEAQAELLTVQQESGRRARGGQPAPRSGAYPAALRQRERIAAAGSVPGAGGTWEPAGRGPLISDDERYDEVNQLGLADVNGRISDFAFDPATRRLFAAVGEGGVWVADEADGFDQWRSIGDTLPTQAVGAIDFSPANGGTIVIATGDNVFGGGGTFAGDGVYHTTDDGETWQKATGVPSGVIAFKVAVDPTNENVVYAATGAGLYRSTDAGASFVNVDLPTGEGVPAGAPDCTGKGPDVEGCFLANMVTDVVVAAPDNTETADASRGAQEGSVVAAVGWRAGNKTSPPSQSYPSGYPESPNNGIYTSLSGEPGSFEKLDGPTAAPFNDEGRIGRVELGHADGPGQDHNFLYAIVEDAVRFRGGAPVIDANSDPSGPIPNNTVLDGIYVSGDFGGTWDRMNSGDDLKDGGTGSALFGTGCALQYCPGIQAWYNLFVSPDPTRQDASGVPTRLTFGIEEVWQNCNTSDPQDATPAPCSTGPNNPPNTTAQFDVIGPYFAGDTCLFLNTGLPDCPTTAGSNSTTTHPDQHASIWIPHADDGGVTYVVGHDGGVNVQSVEAGAELSPDEWGRGANNGFNTLLPYDAQVAEDGTIWAGLQDNGELKIEPDGDQYQTYGGDGAFSAVDPDNSDVAYESYTFNDISKTTDGGETWSSVAPPEDSYQFINPYTMDPADPSHLITAGNSVHETTDGAENWETVFNLGEGEGGSDNIISAIDVRGVGTPLPTGGKTDDFTFDGSSPPTVPGGGSDLPGTYDDTPFTIAPDEGNARATIEITWADANNDWDMYVYREGQDAPVGSSAQGGTNSEKVVLSRPAPGNYVIRVQNYAATGAFSGTAKFDPAGPGDTAATGSAAYVAFCGYCDALNTRPFANGLASNVTPDGEIGTAGSSENWAKFEPEGLPERYITSIQIDPSDSRTVYATLGGYSRRWLPPGKLGENADVGGGNVYRSTDAGRTFTDISGNLPDIPANWTLVRNGQLVVGTNLGVFVSSDTSGGTYEVLGSGLPTAPVFTMELKPKASAAEPDTLIAATQGRGVYRYEFADEGRPAPPAPSPFPTAGGGTGATTGGGSAPAGGGSSPTACTASRALTAASARPAGRGLKIGFRRSVDRPVTVDVFQQSIGRRVIGERLVARFEDAERSFTWNGRANRRGRTVRDGIFMVRFRLRESNGQIDARRLDRQRTGASWSNRPAHYGREGCTLLRSYKLERPVFGGTGRKSLGIAYRLLDTARVSVTVKRGKRVVKRYRTATKAAGRTHRVRFSQKNRPRGDYKVTVRAARGGRTVQRTLTSRKL